MLTVHEVSRLTGLSVRALRYYDAIGLLKPKKRTDAGYRLYDDEDLAVIGDILMYRELQFPLKDIILILRSPDYDRLKALDRQITLLEMRKERLNGIIALARDIRRTGGLSPMDLKAFDTRDIDRYAAEAKTAWGHTDEYREYEKRSGNRTKDEEKRLGEEMMAIFEELGALKDRDPNSEAVQAVVLKLRDFITEHWYPCRNEVFLGLAQMYAAGGEMTRNIDRRGGEGTGAFACEAIKAFCER